MTALVGYTGFVGSNIYASSNGGIQDVYNSKNILEAYGTKPDLLIYAGLRAEKFLANNDPVKDMELIHQAEDNIEHIAPKKLVLISTIDIFKQPRGVDENSNVETEGLQAYGYNRYQFELWVRDRYPDGLIIRLPALFGRNIKKNFIYDYIHVIPKMLSFAKMNELSVRAPEIVRCYDRMDNGFYTLKALSAQERADLRSAFRGIGFSALNFTDDRSRYQFYDLRRLWRDIQTALSHELKTLHLATEPVSAGELYEYLSGTRFVNRLDGQPADYDYRTIHGEVFSGNGATGYICSKMEVMESIKGFVQSMGEDGKP